MPYCERCQVTSTHGHCLCALNKREVERSTSMEEAIQALERIVLERICDAKRGLKKSDAVYRHVALMRAKQLKRALSTLRVGLIPKATRRARRNKQSS